MKVGVYHDLPTGGALRVLAEWLARTRLGPVTIFTRDAGVHDFVGITTSDVIERPRLFDRLLAPHLVRDALTMPTTSASGRRMANVIRAHGCDVVFCFPSRLTQAPDILPWLDPPSLYYAPEPLRVMYEPSDLVREPSSRVAALPRALGRITVGRYRGQLDRRFIWSASQVVTHSEYTRQSLRRCYGIESSVVPLGVDTQLFRPGTGRRDSFVLSVGAFTRLKGHEFVIEAVSRLRQPRPRVVLVGDRGSGSERLRQMAASLGVSLTILQKASLPVLVRYYQTAGVVACAQIGEPFGLIPLEAMACGCPVVAVDDGGFSETVCSGETGILVPRDSQAFADALSRLLDPTGAGVAMGLAGRDRVVAEWSWHKSVSSFDDLLVELVVRR